MRCQSCQQEEATIHYFESVNGATRSLNLCERCAGASAPAMQFPILRVSEVELTGAEAPTPEAAEAFNQLALPLEEPAACVGCGRSYADFRHDPRHACPACFDNFATPAQLRRRPKPSLPLRKRACLRPCAPPSKHEHPWSDPHPHRG